MNAAEIISVIVAVVLIIAVPWVGTLLGTRNFDKTLDNWRTKTQIRYANKDSEV